MLKFREIFGRQFDSDLKAWTLEFTDLDMSFQDAI